MPTTSYFSTQIFSDRWNASRLNVQLLREIQDLSELDTAGRTWSRENYKNGFTSYASANKLQKISPTFEKLEKWISGKVNAYAKRLELDLQGGRLKMTNCWANLMRANTHHSMHIHPLSVISGTYYVSVPTGAPAIKFEDPRLPLMMHSPPRASRARRENRTHIEVPARPGSLVLFESWMRHEVPLHSGRSPRVSVSFNYDWE
ncbi:MAG TPA: TIGR02466 family protein [Bdellovibrionota bacterium]|jgi:uncharacterized protein (TIGR02466 family)